jgi:tetratricopeptide (TPR) repeat protein
MSEHVSVDDLWSSLDGSTGRERCGTLIALGDKLLENDEFGQALPLVETAAEEAEALDDPRLGWEAHVLRGRLLYGLGRFEESASAHLRAAELAESVLDVAGAGQAFALASDSLTGDGDLEAATTCAERAEAAFVAADDEDGAANLALVLGRLLWLRDHNVAALAALDRARTRFRRLRIPTGVLDADGLCAAALLDEGRADDAVRVLEASLLVAPSVDGWSVPYTQRRLARALRHAGRVEEALTLAASALAALEGGHLLFDVAVTRLEEAECLRALGRATDALLALAAARAHFDIAAAEGDVIHCDELRARWLHADGRYVEAAEVNARLAASEDDAVAYDATTRLAHDHWAAGEPQRCLEVLEAAAESPSSDQRGPLLRAGIRARALLQLERVDEARDTAQQALDGDSAGAPPALLAPLYEVLAVTHSEIRDHRVHAVALHLAAGDAARAASLAEELLP